MPVAQTPNSASGSSLVNAKSLSENYLANLLQRDAKLRFVKLL
jgi:hypothetical protein